MQSKWFHKTLAGKSDRKRYSNRTSGNQENSRPIPLAGIAKNERLQFRKSDSYNNCTDSMQENQIRKVKTEDVISHK